MALLLQKPAQPRCRRRGRCAGVRGALCLLGQCGRREPGKRAAITGSTSGRAGRAVDRTECQPEPRPSRRALGAPTEMPVPDGKPHGSPAPPGSSLWPWPLWLLVALGPPPSQSLTRAASTPQDTPAKQSSAGAKNRSTVWPRAAVEAEFLLNDSFKYASTLVPL